MAGQVARLAELVCGADSVVALTGAGISVPSGIPDFRTPGTGLWEDIDPMEVAHIDAWRRDPERFWRFYGDRFATLQDKEPNNGHDVLVTLEQTGHLDAVITQNVDMLHRRAGTEELVEMHGSIASSSCLKDGNRYDLDETLARLHDSPFGVPECDCGAPLKPGVVLFGEDLDEDALQRAYDLCLNADLLIAIGTSLEVHPVAALPRVTLDAGGRLALVTAGITPWDVAAEVKLAGDVEEELEALLEAVEGFDAAAAG